MKEILDAHYFKISLHISAYTKSLFNIHALELRHASTLCVCHFHEMWINDFIQHCIKIFWCLSKWIHSLFAIFLWCFCNGVYLFPYLIPNDLNTMLTHFIYLRSTFHTTTDYNSPMVTHKVSKQVGVLILRL
jgi:hypothetical protein